MKLTQLAWRGLAAAMLSSALVASALAWAPASSPDLAAAAGPARITTTDPQVPRGLGKPCVVELFHNQPFLEDFEPSSIHFTYGPPPDCPKPWAQVILTLDISDSGHPNLTPPTRLGVDLAGVPIFRGTTPRYGSEASWHVERDLTDDASLLKVPNDGRIVALWDGDSDFDHQTQINGSARLLFYRTSVNTPAPRVPDVVHPLNPSGPTSLRLPHNIVRAYVDVFNALPWWFTCVPDQSARRFPALISRLAPGDEPQLGIFPESQGCAGGSFQEREVFIDGTAAGVVPYFPLLSADFNPFLPNTVDQPAPPSQMLNFMPYRVDLTPFAGLLNDAGAHTIRIQEMGRPGVGEVSEGQLLLYVDRRTVHVTGGVTLNTLTGSSAIPTVVNTLSASGDVLHGKVVTHLERNFEIRGFVNTSHGLIRSTVTQSGSFRNTQVLHLLGLRDYDHSPFPVSYEQNIWLTNTVNRTSRRMIGAKVISNDQERVAYPLRFRYHAEGIMVDEGDGPIIEPTRTSMGAHQDRFLNGDHYRAGLVRYITDLDDVFDGSRARDFVSGGPDTYWKSFREYSFGDNLGSCHENALTTQDGAVDAQVQGVGCPHNLNRVRWFAHPDGSPDGLGWAH